jgi:histidinol dehydrogenase
VIPILYSARDREQIEALRDKLSLKPLLQDGLGDDDDASAGAVGGAGSKFRIVREILKAVRERGDAAVFDYTERFEKVRLTPATMRVSAEQVAAAVREAAPELIAALDAAIANVRAYQTAMLAPEPKPIRAPGGGAGSLLGVKFTPLERVGLYVPGGAAAYPSSVIMTAVPAQVAGVKELVLCSPLRNGTVAPAVLVAAARVGVTEIYGIGGAQAIAALAFGTATIRAVDKIVGPGNTYVQLAKKELYGIVDIDSFAGPSEVIVLADDSAAAGPVAGELLAQAEHAPGSCLLITASETLARAVQAELERQLGQLGRRELTVEALKFASALIVTESPEEALALVDAFAPEHLQITTRAAAADARRIKHAGATFIGPYTPVAAGDYLAGPSHVLPTSGTARFFSGLSAESFRKRTSLIQLDQAALAAMTKPIVDLATIEGFDAHAKSVVARSGGGSEGLRV